MRAALALVLTGCVTQHKVTVTGNRLREQMSTLQAKGEAKVPVQDERIGEGTATRREVIRLDQGLTVDGQPRAVRDLIAGCENGAPCALTELATFPMEVRRYDTRNVGSVIGGLAVLTVAGATGWAVGCGIVCDDGSTGKKAAYVTMGIVGVAVVGLLVWIVIDCASGPGRCHD